MIDGSVKKSIARLHPIRDMKHPNEKDPRKAPKQLILPIHEICSFVNGPASNGVCSEANLPSAGAIQPTMQPCDNIMRFALKKFGKLSEISLKIYSKN